jgi:2-hydroxycyclohexanecarboxyl-CoA dehydrogenase
MTGNTDLSGQTAVVTGSTGGIGAATARRLAACGAAVVVNGRDAQRGAEVVTDIERAGGQATFVRADLNAPTELQGLMEEANNAYGGIDILVNNGGAADAPKPDFFEEMATDDILAWCEAGYANRLYGVHAALEYLKRAEGTVVNVTADAGRVPTPAEVGPGGAAAALLMATRVLAKELARHRINVNAVSLSVVDDTPAQRALMDESEESAVFEQAFQQQTFEVTPDDAADAVVSLVDAPAVTGQVLSVNGGVSFPG